MSQTATILVIDDEPQIRKFLRISLASQGYKVIEAGTGNEGLAQAALSKPDLLVLDLGLPDMDGQQVLREFREWSTVPVLVLSVRASEVQKVEALDGGRERLRHQTLWHPGVSGPRARLVAPGPSGVKPRKRRCVLAR